MALSTLLVPPGDEEHGGTVGGGGSHHSRSNTSRRLDRRRALLLLRGGVEDARVGGRGWGSRLVGSRATRKVGSRGERDGRVDEVHQGVHAGGRVVVERRGGDLQVQGERVEHRGWDISQGQGGDVSQALASVQRDEALHHDLLQSQAQTVSQTLGEPLEDLSGRDWVGHDERVVQREEETNLDEGRVGWRALRGTVRGRDDPGNGGGDACGHS